MYDKRWAEEPEVGAAGPKAVGRSRLRRQPYTILRYRRLVAEKFDGSQHRRYPGVPRFTGRRGSGGANGDTRYRLG